MACREDLLKIYELLQAYFEISTGAADSPFEVMVERS